MAYIQAAQGKRGRTAVAAVAAAVPCGYRAHSRAAWCRTASHVAGASGHLTLASIVGESDPPLPCVRVPDAVDWFVPYSGNHYTLIHSSYRSDGTLQGPFDPLPMRSARACLTFCLLTFASRNPTVRTAGKDTCAPAARAYPSGPVIRWHQAYSGICIAYPLAFLSRPPGALV